MIVLINGMLGTNAEHISKIIALELAGLKNARITYSYDIDSDNSFNINYTYAGQSNTDIQHDYDEPDFIPEEEINEFKSKVMDTISNKILNVSTTYLDSNMYDIGYVNDTVPEYNINFDDIKNIEDFKIINGHFGKYFIDEIIKNFPNEKVITLNIIRNPLISNLISDLQNKHIREFHTILDLLNCSLLTSLDYVQTVKFEEILKNKMITIDNKPINFSEDYAGDVYSAYELKNENIKTIYESNSFDFSKNKELFSNLNIVKRSMDSNKLSELFKKYISNGYSKEAIQKKLDSYDVNVFQKLKYKG